MSEDKGLWSPAFDDFGDELRRVARAESGARPRRRRWIIAIVGVCLLSAPAAVAVTSDDDESVPVPAPGSPEAGPMDPDQRKPPLIAPE